ncbi:MAG: SUF system Fe-S cluster assembly protein [Flavobacteriales bacterium]|nr:SUF system Fe-S cluster assembly protein [Flavobacteriales bacterium]
MSEEKKHIEQLSKKDIEQQIIDTLKTVYDPEIPVDIYEMGLIYEIQIDDDLNVVIQMTLTSPSCPVAESLPEEVRQKVESLWSVKSAKVELTWEPAWDKDMMSEEAKLELGFL